MRKPMLVTKTVFLEVRLLLRTECSGCILQLLLSPSLCREHWRIFSDLYPEENLVGFLEVKFMKIQSLPKTGLPGVFLSQASPHSVSSNLSISQLLSLSFATSCWLQRWFLLLVSCDSLCSPLSSVFWVIVFPVTSILCCT